jgi:hypothetical protein
LVVVFQLMKGQGEQAARVQQVPDDRPDGRRRQNVAPSAGAARSIFRDKAPIRNIESRSHVWNR